MGAQWKQKGREISALKRGQLFGKLAKEIIVAAKLGGADPDLNARLFVAVEAAKKHSDPRDTIERAIKKGAGLTGETVNYELVTYEGFAPHKVPVIVECLTDNRNRTAPDIRMLFKNGHLGAMGSVKWMFDHLGVVANGTWFDGHQKALYGSGAVQRGHGLRLASERVSARLLRAGRQRMQCLHRRLR